MLKPVGHVRSCDRCPDDLLTLARLRRSPAARIVGYALWADALVTLALAVGGAALAPRTEAVSTSVREAKHDTAAALRRLPSLSSAAVARFMETGSLTDGTIGRLSARDRRQAVAILSSYETRAARAAVIKAVADFGDARLPWTAAGLAAVGWLLVRDKRVRQCRACGAVHDRGRVVAPRAPLDRAALNARARG